MWVTFFLISFTACIQFAILNIREYLQYDVVTRITTVTEIPTKFPQVIVCSSDMFATEFAFEFARKTLANRNMSNLWDRTLAKNKYHKMLMTRAEHRNVQFEFDKADAQTEPY
jgi:hypothetical protein